MIRIRSSQTKERETGIKRKEDITRQKDYQEGWRGGSEFSPKELKVSKMLRRRAWRGRKVEDDTGRQELETRCP